MRRTRTTTERVAVAATAAAGLAAAALWTSEAAGEALCADESGELGACSGGSDSGLGGEPGDATEPDAGAGPGDGDPACTPPDCTGGGGGAPAGGTWDWPAYDPRNPGDDLDAEGGAGGSGGAGAGHGAADDGMAAGGGCDVVRPSGPASALGLGGIAALLAALVVLRRRRGAGPPVTPATARAAHRPARAPEPAPRRAPAARAPSGPLRRRASPTA